MIKKYNQNNSIIVTSYFSYTKHSLWLYHYYVIALETSTKEIILFLGNLIIVKCVYTHFDNCLPQKTQI